MLFLAGVGLEDCRSEDFIGCGRVERLELFGVSGLEAGGGRTEAGRL